MEKFDSLTKFLSIYKRKKTSVAGLVFFCFLAIAGILAPLIAPFNPFELSGEAFVPPSNQHIMGTDDFGRDILSGVIYGSTASLVVGFSSAVISAVIGILIGSISGFFGGEADVLLMRFTEVFQVLPTFVFALTILALFGGSFTNVIIAIAIVSWPSNARLVRSNVLSVREQEFVTAAKAVGMGEFRIIFSEILPNVVPPVIVNTALQVASAITAESGLGFLGLSDPKVMTWGCMLGNARPFLLRAWWMMTFPGLCILATVLALHFVADGLNYTLNPQRWKY